MKIYVMIKSSTTYGGGHPTSSLARCWLQSELSEYGSAIRELTFTICFRGGRVIGPLSEEFHSKFLPSLPRARFMRKKGRMDIDYQTTLADAEFLDYWSIPTAESFVAAMRELVGHAELIRSRLKRTDDFNADQLFRDLHDAIARLPNSDRQLKKLDRALEKQESDRNASLDEWERLGVDWDDYHQAARTLLDDPIFWSQSDDNAPHGNDTGADLLAEFVTWNRRNRTKPAHELARRLLRAWEIPSFDYSVVAPDKVKSLVESDPIALGEANDAFIATAFASIKLRGYCDTDTAALAFAALDREGLTAVMRGRGWKNASQRKKRLACFLPL
jgi:uncharacterized protein YfeS